MGQGKARAHVDRPLCCGDRLLGLPDRIAVDGQRVEGIRIAVGQPHRQSHGLRLLGEIGRAVLRPAEKHRAVEAADQPDVALGERGVRGDGTAEARARLRVVLAGDVMEVPLAAEHEIPGIHPLGGLAPRPQRLRAHHAGLDRPDHPPDDLVLQREQILELAIVAVGPEMMAGVRLDQLGRDAHPVARAPRAALDHVADAELAPDLLDRYRPPLVGEARVAGDDEEPAILRQRRRSGPRSGHPQSIPDPHPGSCWRTAGRRSTADPGAAGRPCAVPPPATAPAAPSRPRRREPAARCA